MSQFDQRSYRALPRKRKRPYSASTASKTSSELLRLDDSSKPQAKYSILDEEKVINSLNKFGVRGDFTSSRRIYCIRILVGLTEAEYFKNQGEAFVKRMIDTFHIGDLQISEHQKGSVERIISIYGEYAPIAKVAVYIGSVLCSKLNNVLQAELFTLKSSNYKLKLLVSTNDEKKIREMSNYFGLVDFDTSMPFNFNQNPNLYSIYVRGDLHSLFDFFVELIHLNSSYENFDDSKIKMTKLTGIHLDGGIYIRSEEETNTLKKHTNDVLSFIYSKSFLSKDN